MRNIVAPSVIGGQPVMISQEQNRKICDSLTTAIASNQPRNPCFYNNPCPNQQIWSCPLHAQKQGVPGGVMFNFAQPNYCCPPSCLPSAYNPPPPPCPQIVECPQKTPQSICVDFGNFGMEAMAFQQKCRQQCRGFTYDKQVGTSDQVLFPKSDTCCCGVQSVTLTAEHKNELFHQVDETDSKSKLKLCSCDQPSNRRCCCFPKPDPNKYGSAKHLVIGERKERSCKDYDIVDQATMEADAEAYLCCNCLDNWKKENEKRRPSCLKKRCLCQKQEESKEVTFCYRGNVLAITEEEKKVPSPPEQRSDQCKIQATKSHNQLCQCNQDSSVAVKRINEMKKQRKGICRMAQTFRTIAKDFIEQLDKDIDHFREVYNLDKHNKMGKENFLKRYKCEYLFDNAEFESKEGHVDEEASSIMRDLVKKIVSGRISKERLDSQKQKLNVSPKSSKETTKIEKVIKVTPSDSKNTIKQSVDTEALDDSFSKSVIDVVDSLVLGAKKKVDSGHHPANAGVSGNRLEENRTAVLKTDKDRSEPPKSEQFIASLETNQKGESVPVDPELNEINSEEERQKEQTFKDVEIEVETLTSPEISSGAKLLLETEGKQYSDGRMKSTTKAEHNQEKSVGEYERKQKDGPILRDPEVLSSNTVDVEENEDQILNTMNSGTDGKQCSDDKTGSNTKSELNQEKLAREYEQNQRDERILRDSEDLRFNKVDVEESEAQVLNTALVDAIVSNIGSLEMNSDAKMGLEPDQKTSDIDTTGEQSTDGSDKKNQEENELKLKASNSFELEAVEQTTTKGNEKNISEITSDIVIRASASDEMNIVETNSENAAQIDQLQAGEILELNQNLDQTEKGNSKRKNISQTSKKNELKQPVDHVSFSDLPSTSKDEFVVVNKDIQCGPELPSSSSQTADGVEEENTREKEWCKKILKCMLGSLDVENKESQCSVEETEEKLCNCCDCNLDSGRCRTKKKSAPKPCVPERSSETFGQILANVCSRTMERAGHFLNYMIRRPTTAPKDQPFYQNPSIVTNGCDHNCYARRIRRYFSELDGPRNICPCRMDTNRFCGKTCYDVDTNRWYSCCEGFSDGQKVVKITFKEGAERRTIRLENNCRNSRYHVVYE